MIKDEKGYNFESAEGQVKALWEKNNYFEKLRAKNRGNEYFRFLDGPITANNAMGIHHAFGRTLKDITLRYNSMLGKDGTYQNGFDAQGLWVEVEVEKQLGFKDKSDIVKFGMDNFTNTCMSRVQKYAAVITEQSKDLGQWMDWSNSYFTNTDDNILGIWHFLKKCDDLGWLVKKHRVMSWCPRCGTSLSEHEMSGSYSEVTCNAVFFRMPINEIEADLLVWTTTPWTLTSNCAVAVNPELDYSFVALKEGGRPVICGASIVKKVIGKNIKEIIKTVKGKELLGLTYTTIFPEFEVQKFTHKVIPWEDIVDSEGTGLVHIAPGCGEEDFNLGLKYDIPAISPIDEAGRIIEGFGDLAGKTTTEVAEDIFAELRARGNMYATEEYTHKYAHCWRCKTDIVFKLVDEWYIKSDEIRPKMLEAVETVEWQPAHVKKRMIDWLNNMTDWNISRKRFYGLPLPFYVCPDCGKITVIGSREELIERSSKEEVEKIPHFHRPWIDDIEITCECGAKVKRVTEVGDCWLDAGITPFVTKKYFSDREFWRKNFPSDVVIEMVEQVRLWFYSILFMSVTLEGCAPYKKVVTHGSVVRENGEKFSKSAGKEKNIVLNDAIKVMGADTIRYLYAGTTSVNDLRFGYTLGDDAKRRILAFYNTYTFFNTYASIDKPNLDGYKPSDDELSASDKWALLRTNEFIKIANENYSNQMYQPVLKAFEALVDDINNWYIRINRKRFWKGTPEEKQVAYYTLYTVIKSVVRVMAPIIPFMTDFIWHDSVREFEKNECESVHLSDFPTELELGFGDDLIGKTALARDIIALVQKIRNEKAIMIKQPLSDLYLVANDEIKGAVEIFDAAIKSEVNIKNISFVENTDAFVTPSLSVNFGKAGGVLRKDVNKFKEFVAGLSDEKVAEVYAALNAEGKVKFDEFEPEITKDLFNIALVAKNDYAIEADGDITLVLSLAIDEKLEEEYMVRSLIRKLQVYRKDMGLKIESRIRIALEYGDEEIEKIVSDNLDTVMSELLVIGVDAMPEGADKTEIEVGEHTVKVAITLVD